MPDFNSEHTVYYFDLHNKALQESDGIVNAIKLCPYIPLCLPSRSISVLKRNPMYKVCWVLKRNPMYKEDWRAGE